MNRGSYLPHASRRPAVVASMRPRFMNRGSAAIVDPFLIQAALQ